MNAVNAARPFAVRAVGRLNAEAENGRLPGTLLFGNLFVRVSAAQAGIRARKGRHTERG
jgi:hypothetical protein